MSSLPCRTILSGEGRSITPDIHNTSQGIMSKIKTYYMKKPRLLWIIVFSVPALAGILGFFLGLYEILISKEEIELGIVMVILMSLAALGFGSYVLTSIGPYRNPDKYYLQLGPDKIVLSKGKTNVLIPRENLTKATNDVVQSVWPNLPALHWTTMEYEENNQTKIERFVNNNYGGHNFANIIKRKYKKC